MFDLGIQELILIFIVVLLVFGPKKLPELSRALGRGIREIKIALRGVKESVEDAETQMEEKIAEQVPKDIRDLKDIYGKEEKTESTAREGPGQTKPPAEQNKPSASEEEKNKDK
jgi:TatA/E family protein of Tat protein translocase